MLGSWCFPQPDGEAACPSLSAAGGEDLESQCVLWTSTRLVITGVSRKNPCMTETEEDRVREVVVASGLPFRTSPQRVNVRPSLLGVGGGGE